MMCTLPDAKHSTAQTMTSVCGQIVNYIVVAVVFNTAVHCISRQFIILFSLLCILYKQFFLLITADQSLNTSIKSNCWTTPANGWRKLSDAGWSWRGRIWRFDWYFNIDCLSWWNGMLYFCIWTVHGGNWGCVIMMDGASVCIFDSHVVSFYDTVGIKLLHIVIKW